jgi:nucleotide-binding universal stress UspA family protein
MTASTETEKTMAIVCGTDFSENATQAARAAGALARRLGLPLKLVHVIGERDAQVTAAINQDIILDALRQRIRDQAAEIAPAFDIEVEPMVVPGIVHEKLNEIARDAGARLIVVAPLGDKKQHQWLLGSVAERVAQTSAVPVLVVRESASIEAWALGKRPLRVMVGADIGSSSKPALRWAARLRALEPCDLLVTQVVWPLGEHFRLGIPSPIPLDRLRPELHDLLTRNLHSWAGDVPGQGETAFTVSPGWGRVDTHLALLAAEAKADLLVVGTHQRAGSALFWQGSVSRGVLHQASCNVVCVPRNGTGEDAEAIASFHRVLIPTDFSTIANRAIPAGYGLVKPGGIIHLLHVSPRKATVDDTDLKERLRALIPKGAAAKGVTTEIEVTSADDASTGIWHAAGRLGVDAICMATHGRSGLSQAMLGSQAQEVIKRCRQPVLLVPPEREG